MKKNRRFIWCIILLYYFHQMIVDCGVRIALYENVILNLILGFIYILVCILSLLEINKLIK